MQSLGSNSQGPIVTHAPKRVMCYGWLVELRLRNLCYAFLNGSPVLGHFFRIVVLGPRHFGSRSPALGHACKFAVGSCTIPEDSMEP